MSLGINCATGQKEHHLGVRLNIHALIQTVAVVLLEQRNPEG